MELFEDLEFKPITEGLGFHRNASSSPASAQSSPSAPLVTNSSAGQATPPKMREFTSSVDSLKSFRNSNFAPASTSKSVAPKASKSAFVPSLKPEYNFLDEESLNETKRFAQELTQPKANPDRTKIYEPIGRKDYLAPQIAKNSEASKAASFSIPIPGAPASLSALRNQNIEKNKLTPEQKASTGARANFTLQSKVTTLTNTTPAPAAPMNLRKTHDLTLVTCIPAAILDSVFAIGVSLILLVGVLLVTKADLVGLLSNSKTDHFVQFQIGILFLMVLQMYSLLSRSTVFGQSIGEWTYDIQLGTDEQRRRALYPLQVVFRGILFALTGFVLLPLLSELFGRDLAAPLTGLKIQKTTQQGIRI